MVVIDAKQRTIRPIPQFYPATGKITRIPQVNFRS
jgi:hypothetical protein